VLWDARAICCRTIRGRRRPRYPDPIARLADTDLDVFPLCLGGNVFGWTLDEARSFAVLDAFVAGGGNFIDTADTYGRHGAAGPSAASEAG
jgi:aryl-alcohol dehydrogenase-like predicted oxidoreductase